MLDILPCFVLLLVVALPTLFLVVLVVRRRGRHVGDPACGKCGYWVRGLPTFICPECGSDLREVGIITAGQSGMTPMMRGAVLVLLWTLVLPIPAIVLSAVVFQLTPQIAETRSQRSLLSPDSGAYQQIGLEQKLTEKGNRVISNRLTYTLIPSQGQAIRIEVDPISLGYRYRTRSGEQVEAASGLNESTLLDWMSQAGIDHENKQVKLEAAELLSFAQTAATGTVDTLSPRHFRSGDASQFSSVGSATWVLAVASVFWLVVWFLGCWKLWKIGTRR